MPDNALQPGKTIAVEANVPSTLPDIIIMVEVSPGLEVTFTLKSFGEVTCDWWTPEAGKIMCTLCGKSGKDPDITDLLNPDNPCHLCLNRNAYCG